MSGEPRENGRCLETSGAGAPRGSNPASGALPQIWGVGQPAYFQPHGRAKGSLSWGETEWGWGPVLGVQWRGWIEVVMTGSI